MSAQAHIKAISKVSRSELETMYALFARYYDNVNRDKFYRDFGEKSWVILLLNHHQRIVGFSTMQMITRDINDRTHWFLFSGDTIVDIPVRQSSALAGAFGHVMLRLMQQYGEETLHWFLISKGMRTYRFLPVFFHTFIPAYDQVPSREQLLILQAIARHKFGDRYDATSGIIYMQGEGDWLKPEPEHISSPRLQDPHVSFFHRRNPTADCGDELACLATISKPNLTQLAWRVIRQTQVVWDE